MFFSRLLLANVCSAVLLGVILLLKKLLGQRVSQKFALPGGMKWKLLLNTAKEPAVLREPEYLTDIREIQVERQSVCLLSGTESAEEILPEQELSVKQSGREKTKIKTKGQGK